MAVNDWGRTVFPYKRNKQSNILNLLMIMETFLLNHQSLSVFTTPPDFFLNFFCKSTSLFFKASKILSASSFEILFLLRFILLIIILIFVFLFILVLILILVFILIFVILIIFIVLILLLVLLVLQQR